MNGGSNLEPGHAVAFDELIGDKYRVVHVRHHNTLLQNELFEVISPDGQAIFQPEFIELTVTLDLKPAAREFAAAETIGHAAGQPDMLRQWAE